MKWVFFICFLGVNMLGEVLELDATIDNLKLYKQIVDIRTPQEYQDTGIIKNSILVPFINNKEKFIQRLQQAGIKISEPIALICRTGRRTFVVAHMLNEEYS
ncbi:MAG: rhodanese-like domain-containing protein, partial [Campylobacter sp.]|nr:rhodanese-like domain-containing protein [Campylobacter sp.]